MKIITKSTRFITLFFIFIFIQLQASPYSTKPDPFLSKTANNCVSGSAYAELKIGMVRAFISNSGVLWLNGPDNLYEVPKYSHKNCMLAGSLWIGGFNDNNQLKIAAMRYHQVGSDYFPGPLSTTDASTEITLCQQYDFIHEIKREDVVNFVNFYLNPSAFPNYTIPSSIINYPAHGDITYGQSYYLAPFFDYNDDGTYNPLDGDYPLYDFSFCQQTVNHPTSETENGISHGGRLSDQALKGDQTLWWVFNDAGNIHTESGGTEIGLEIRAQAYAFERNDEIGYSTFYTYEIINRSSESLHDVYVGFYSDFDVGYFNDDYIGSDILRGLGYAYNGKTIDGTGLPSHYGINPPAVGIDFLQGPYMDADGIDNPRFQVNNDNGIITIENCDYSINGQNFQNNIIDDERMGMTSFELLMCCPLGGISELVTVPNEPYPYYYRMSSRLNDGSVLQFGGNAHPSMGAYGPDCRFMFPGDSDPCYWNTYGQMPNGSELWTETTAGNMPADRRAAQGSGPFSLPAGGTNYVTIGVPFARATSGGPYASVELLKINDDKIQTFFDNCFRIVEAPDAPDLTIQEMNNELILYISNKSTSNNFGEKFSSIDPLIISPDSFSIEERIDSTYDFEGYQVFQVTSPDVTIDMLHDPDMARLVAQCDLKNNVSRVINYSYSQDLNAYIPTEEVDGENKGLVHSFRIFKDAFSSNESKLVNFKKYYFLAVAYAHNEYEKFSADPNYQIEGIASVSGQKKPYLSSSSNIHIVTGIPHNPIPESNGSIFSSYGTQIPITRIEGQGNGGNVLRLDEKSLNSIIENGFEKEITYLGGYAPIKVQVTDPLNVKPANYVLRIDSSSYDFNACNWKLEIYDTNNILSEIITSDFSINVANEQLFPALGISISVSQCLFPGDLSDETNGYIESKIETSDGSTPWLDGIGDIDNLSIFDWIRSGVADADNSFNDDYSPGNFIDPNEQYENILGGTWAPYRLSSSHANMPVSGEMGNFLSLTKLKDLSSVQIVFTSDKSKWSRCVVVETCDNDTLSEGNAKKLSLRRHASVDQYGNPDGSSTGMGWFPGYVINLETGERLNIMFGEDSHLTTENGFDMLFNPTQNILGSANEVLLGGKHFIYIINPNTNGAPAYDSCSWAYQKLSSGSSLDKRHVYNSVSWTSIPVLREGSTLLSSDVTVFINVKKPFARNYSLSGAINPVNKNYPMYRFSTMETKTITNDINTAKSALDLINVVPNPYYGNNEYETSIYDQIVKITNLPMKCTISIFNINGSIVRKIVKDDNLTYYNWDIKNENGTTIAGGLYLIHIQAPGIGEKTIKWLGTMHTIKTREF